MSQSIAGMRLDKWLWAARVFKTRSLAVDAIERGRVQVNRLPVKPARELHLGDEVSWRQPQGPAVQVIVRGLSATRGPAPTAQALYEETADSLLARARAAEQRCLSPEPGTAQTQGRPTKRDRRDLDRKTIGWQRWSASIDEP